MPVAVVLVFLEAGLVANFAVAVPVVVMFEAPVWTIPEAAVVAATFMAGSDPARPGIRWTAPVTFMPAIVSGNGIPVTADPDIVGSRLGGHDDDRAQRRWRANLDADRYLSFRGNACQQ